MDEDREGAPKAVLESVAITEEMAILRLPDIDGRPIYFSSYAISKETDFGWPGTRNEVLKDFGNEGMVVKGELNELQRERLAYALEELKLPTILAVHVALNTQKDLGNMPKPKDDDPTPVCLAMQGRPGVGKSFMTAMISTQGDFPVLNLDPVSGTEANKYIQHFKVTLSGDELRNLSVERGRELIVEVKEELGSNKERPVKTLRQMLDEGIEKFMAMEHRPALILVDMPGIPGEYNFGTGSSHGRDRAHNVFDLVAAEACESIILSTHQLMEETMTRKLKWIKDEVIGKHFGVWQEMRRDFEEGVKRKRV